VTITVQDLADKDKSFVSADSISKKK